MPSLFHGGHRFSPGTFIPATSSVLSLLLFWYPCAFPAQQPFLITLNCYLLSPSIPVASCVLVMSQHHCGDGQSSVCSVTASPSNPVFRHRSLCLTRFWLLAGFLVIFTRCTSARQPLHHQMLQLWYLTLGLLLVLKCRFYSRGLPCPSACSLPALS